MMAIRKRIAMDSILNWQLTSENPPPRLTWVWITPFEDKSFARISQTCEGDDACKVCTLACLASPLYWAIPTRKDMEIFERGMRLGKKEQSAFFLKRAKIKKG